jgi:adenylate cyclase
VTVKLDPLREAIFGTPAREGFDPEREGLLDGARTDAERDARRELLDRLADDGATIRELRDAVDRERLPLLALERALSGNGSERYTLPQVAEHSGVEVAYLEALRRALGLAQLAPREVHGSDADVEAARTVQRFREAGVPDEGLLEIARALGHGMSLLAAAIRRVLAQAFAESEASELEAALRYAEVAEELRRELDPLLAYALAVHQREQIGSEVMGTADVAAGFDGSEEVTVCFADLVGFTRLGEKVGPSDLGRLAGRLSDLAVDCARPPVRLVKMIGDAAMFVSHDSDAVVMAALELAQRVSDDPGLPGLRVGIARGQAISRGGEWYGTPINVASKLTAAGKPGLVLTTSEVRDAAAGGLDWSRHRRRQKLSGIGSRLETFHVELPAASRREPWPGYDGATVEQIKRRLADCDMDALQRVRRYEQRHKRRKGVLGALDTQARRLAR